MSTYSLQDVLQSNDRHKLYALLCNQDRIDDCLSWLKSQKIYTINVGRELSLYISGLEDFRYLSIDAYDFVRRLLEKNKAKVNEFENAIVAVYNLGILLEPLLELNPARLFRDFSKDSALIIIWENQSEIHDHLHWSTQQNSVFIDFTETPLKKLQYAI